MNKKVYLNGILCILIYIVSSVVFTSFLFAQEQPQPQAVQVEAAPPQAPPPQAEPTSQALPQPQGGGQVQVPQVQAPPPDVKGQPSDKMPPRFPPPRVLPPAIFVKGKEGNINRVFVEDAQVGKEIKLEFIMFDIDPNEKISVPKTHGLPASASLKFESLELEKNRGAAVLTWTPSEGEVGLRSFAIEVSNSKGEPNRVAFFYNVKK